MWWPSKKIYTFNRSHFQHNFTSGVDFDEVTAGKYKRTMTPFKPATEESRNKVQADIMEILDHFKNHIKHHRPALDIEEVATGEVLIVLHNLMG